MRCCGTSLRKRRLLVLEGTLPQPHRFLVAAQVPLAIRTARQVIVEPGPRLASDFTRQVIHHEVGEFATRHGSGSFDLSIRQPAAQFSRSIINPARKARQGLLVGCQGRGAFSG